MNTLAVAFFLLFGFIDAFQLPTRDVRLNSALNMVYIPDGFTKESYAKFKEQEKKKSAKQNLGGVGPKGFKSRSMQSFQEAMERGEASHLLPVFNAKEKIARGELKLEDIPYMQRGGSWDNSDVRGAKKVKWLESDKDYADGGFKKEQSVSIFGKGGGLDWTGSRARAGGPQQPAAKKSAPAAKKPVPTPQKSAPDEKKKGFFGMF